MAGTSPAMTSRRVNEDPHNTTAGVVPRPRLSSDVRYKPKRLLPAGRLTLLLGLGLLLGFQILAGLLVDHLHGQPHLAALVEA